MKIERVEVFGVAVPLIGEYKNAYVSKSIQKSAIVRITATGGAIGLGRFEANVAAQVAQSAYSCLL
jgi:muconate cycloisomerase